MTQVIAVIPAYNEEGHVPSVVTAMRKFVNHVIVVDDGSTDATASRAREAGAIVISHPDNSGVGAATMTGIEAARVMGADIVITLDADGQHDSSDVPALLKPIIEGFADIVYANRFGQKNKIPFIRRVFNGIGNIVTFLATGLWVKDSQCGFKVFGPRALADIDLKMSGFEFCTEIVRETAQHRWRWVEIPSKVLYSEYTMAKGQSFANGIRTAFKILLRSFLR